MTTTYYYRSGERVPVRVAASARVVKTGDERLPVVPTDWRSTALAPGYELIISEDLVENRRVSDSLEAFSELIVERERESIRNERQHAMSRAERGAAPSLPHGADVVSFPVVVSGDAEGVLFSTGDVVAQFPDPISPGEVERLCRASGWSVQRTLPFIPNGYVLSPDSSADPLAFANDLVERHGALFAHPVFLEDIPERGSLAQLDEDLSSPWRPGDEVERADASTPASLFDRQWHLHNVGQDGARAGHDVNALAAWKITMGSPNITICIIDSGVQAGHESFRGAGKLVPGYDFADRDARPEPTTSSHGTACAAVAAAGPVSRRVLGMAPGCRIMPIRRTGLSDHLALSEALVWAADHGADIINCSWGVDGRPWILPDVARSALVYVTTHGRNGRGCAVFWAAGNGGEQVSADEWASSEYTIAIAASTDQGQQAPYSDYGPEISVCAPSSGGRNGITTAWNDGYTSQFGGTSSAAPLAAGVAALVLSLAPNLRWSELRDLLQRSARKIDRSGGGYDARGHSHYYGYGQVDAFAALNAIDALTEARRATNTEALASDMAHFGEYLRGTAAGRMLVEYAASRRLGILRAIQETSGFRDALARMLRLIADIGARLASDRDISIPEEAWPAIELVATTVRALPADNAIIDRSERSVHEKEADMSSADCYKQIPPGPFGQGRPWWPTFADGESRGSGAAPLALEPDVEALEALYLRPDIRAAVIQIAPALIELLSRNEEAARALSEGLGSASVDADGGERVPDLIIEGGLYLGIRAGIWLFTP